MRLESRKAQIDEGLRELSVSRQLPFYGVPRLTAGLKRRGLTVNHKRVRRLRNELGLRTVYPRPRFNTSVAHPSHRKFPYLLCGLKIDHRNQVWSTDITYTTVNGHRAFVIGIVDWFGRKLMAYNVVNTMDAFHCVETLKMAIERHGNPEICAYPLTVYTNRLIKNSPA